jgi:hypothetical protein
LFPYQQVGITTDHLQKYNSLIFRNGLEWKKYRGLYVIKKFNSTNKNKYLIIDKKIQFFSLITNGNNIYDCPLLYTRTVYTNTQYTAWNVAAVK